MIPFALRHQWPSAGSHPAAGQWRDASAPFVQVLAGLAVEAAEAPLLALLGTEASGQRHARQLPLQWTRPGVASSCPPGAPRHTPQRNRLCCRHGVLEWARRGGASPARPWAVPRPGAGCAPLETQRVQYCRLRVPPCVVLSVGCPPFALFVACCQEVGERVERCARRTSRSPLRCAVAPGYTNRWHRGECLPPAAATTATVRSLQ